MKTMNPAIIMTERSRNKPTLKLAELFKTHLETKLKTKKPKYYKDKSDEVNFYYLGVVRSLPDAVLRLDIVGDEFLQPFREFLACLVFSCPCRREDFDFDFPRVDVEFARSQDFVCPYYRYGKYFTAVFGENECAGFEFSDMSRLAASPFRKNEIRAVSHLLFSYLQTPDGAAPVFAVYRHKVVKPHCLPEHRDRKKFFFCKDPHIYRQIRSDYRNVCDALMVRDNDVSFSRSYIFKAFRDAADSAGFKAYRRAVFENFSAEFSSGKKVKREKDERKQDIKSYDKNYADKTEHDTSQHKNELL